MNLEYKHDRVGPDHKLRNDFRNFLLVYCPEEFTALYKLQEGIEVSTNKVIDELAKLVLDNYSIDFVYQFSTQDIRNFLTYTENLLKAEKALEALKKAVKIAYNAGIDYNTFGGHLVDFYDDLNTEENPFVNRWNRRYE